MSKINLYAEGITEETREIIENRNLLTEELGYSIFLTPFITKLKKIFQYKSILKMTIYPKISEI